ncbi:MAG: SipW-dependent-type signal peptide-containing protein [Acutalibacteraceae bacterium]
MNNTKTTKRALLSSVMAMLICVAMLIGTTFAWFTDKASTTVNKIQAGNLKVQLLDENGNSLEGVPLTWQKAAGHETEEVLWEPGCTYNLKSFKIKNNGDLALKYKLVISGIDGNAELNNVIDWTYAVGTTNPTDLTAEGHLTAGRETDLITITGHMQESAGNEYQGKFIDGIGITVVATQDTVEADSDRTDYDAAAEYPVVTAEQLSEALNTTYTEDTVINITDDITLSGEWGAHSLNGSNNANLVINGNGKTIYGLTSSNYYNLGGFNSNGLVTNIGPGFSSVTFKNLTIDGATLTNNGGETAATGVFVGDTNTVNVTFDTCTVIGANVNSYKWAGGFIGFTQDVYNKSVELINCVVSDSNINTTDSSVGGLVGQNYTNLTITGCQIKGTTTIKCAEDRTGTAAKAGYLLGTATAKTTTISNITVESTVNLDTMGGTTYDTTKYVGRIAGDGIVNGVTPNS